eukprot:4508817-Amphidinium_carterae.2
MCPEATHVSQCACLHPIPSILRAAPATVCNSHLVDEGRKSRGGISAQCCECRHGDMPFRGKLAASPIAVVDLDDDTIEDAYIVALHRGVESIVVLPGVLR